MRVLVLLMAAALLAPLFCADESTEKLLYEGFRLSRLQDLDGARRRFEQALARAQDERNARAEATARLGLGEVLNYRADYAAAREELERALALFQTASDHLSAGMVYNALGFCAWGTGDTKLAGAHYRRALAEFEAAGNLEEKARAVYNLALTSTEPPQKRELIKQGIEAAREAKDRRLEGLLLHLWGDTCFAEGDYGAAAARLEEAAGLLEETAGPRELARVMTSMGRVYRAHGYPDRAIQYYSRALQLQERLGDRQGMIQSLGAIGNSESLLGEHRRALAQYQRALTLARETGSPGLINDQLASLGYAYLQVAEYGRAAELLEEATSAGLRRAPTYTSLSKAYLALGRNQEALAAAESSVKTCQEAADNDSLPGALHQRAVVRQKVGLTVEALADIREALRTIEMFRARLVPNDFMKRGFAGQHALLFGLAIELLHRSGRSAEALEIAEQARARAFLDLLAARETEAPEPAGNPPSGFIRGAEIELGSPATALPISMTRITATAARLRSTLLAYWVAEEAVYVWVVQPGGAVQCVRSAVGAGRLVELVSDSVRLSSGGKASPQIRGQDVLVVGGKQAGVWRELYRLLIRPVAHLLPKTPGSRLTIIPHGPLCQVSFAALLDEKNRYLLERYTLHYAPSVSVLAFTERRKQLPSGLPPRYLLIADPAPPVRAPSGELLPALPGSRRETQAVSRLLPAGAVTLLAGARASEEAVRALAGGSRVVHFATHGILRNDRPFESFLALSGGGAAVDGDGRLTAREIYDLGLEADLVVLSACRTGLGPVSGDGVASLTRAFFYAGTPSVIATLWDVADEPAFLLIPEFYRSWRRLQDKSRALRAAQLALLRSLRAGQVKVATPAGTFTLPEDPVFWAGFVLVGEP